MLGITLSHLWFGLAAASVTGSAYRLVMIYRSGRYEILRQTIVHPVWILFLLVSIVVAANYGVEYLAMPGDETASWLRQARQIFLIDAYWSDKMVYHLGAYTNGWPLLIAFANTMHGAYDDSHGVAVGFVMQLGIIGATYDSIRWVVRNQTALDGVVTRYIGWTSVLALLSVEASWVLLPTFQLIDEPLALAFIGGFITALPGLYPSCNRRLIAFYVGMAFAATYLLKIAALTFLPAAAVLLIAFLYADQRDVGSSKIRTADMTRIGNFAAAIFVPFIIALITWQVFKTGADCNASPIDLLTRENGPAFHQRAAVAVGFVRAVGQFLFTYKLPLTVFAALSLLVGLAHPRTRWLVFALGAFAGAYMVALYLSYVTCLDAISLGRFDAFERHTRVILRVLHFLGPTILLCSLLHVTANKRLVDILSRRKTRVTFAVAIALMLIWQARSVEHSLVDMRTRIYQDPYLRDTIINIRAQAQYLIGLIDERKLRDPRVSLIAQGGYTVEFDLAQYFGIKSKSDGNSNFIYTPVPPYSWAEIPPNRFAAKTSSDALERHWRDFDIIWPYRTDPWIRDTISKMTANPDCAANPENYLLLKVLNADSNSTFECVLKN